MKALVVQVRRKLQAFGKDACGAVTVDWVVLTAALCGMIIAIFTVLTEAVYEDTASSISDTIAGAGDLY